MHQVVTLFDIEDVHGFVAATLHRFERDAGVALEQDEREELHAEGICLLWELAGKYRPHIPGYDQPGRFNGYAARYLPRRLGDAWHKRHPEHKRVTLADGRREWRYLKGTVSLDDFLTHGPAAAHSGLFGRDDFREAELRDASYWTPVPALASAA